MDFLCCRKTHGVPVAQRHKLLHNRNIKGEGCHSQRDAPGTGVVHDLDGFFVSVNVIGKIPLFDHDALGAPCRTGGIDAVSQIAGCDPLSRRICVVGLRFKDILQGQDFKAAFGQSRPFLDQFSAGQQNGRGGILHAEQDPLIRIEYSKGKKSTVRLQHTLLRHIGQFCTLQQNTCQNVTADAFFDK